MGRQSMVTDCVCPSLIEGAQRLAGFKSQPGIAGTKRRLRTWDRRVPEGHADPRMRRSRESGIREPTAGRRTILRHFVEDFMDKGLLNGPRYAGMRPLQPLPVYDHRVGVDGLQYLKQFLFHAGGIDWDRPES